MIATAGSADAAIATLKKAKDVKALGEFQIDPRQLGGIISQIKAIGKEAKDAAEDGVAKLAKEMQEAGNKANALGDVTGDTFDALNRGDFLKAFEKFKKGMADLTSGGGLYDKDNFFNPLAAALTATAMHKIGEVTAKATDEAVKLKREYEAGKISAGEMTEKLIAQLPVIGGIWQTGRNIRELFDMDKDALEDQIKLQQQILNIKTKELDLAKQQKEYQDNLNKRLEDVAAENKAKQLDLGGRTFQAGEMRIDNKLKQDIRDQTEAARKKVEDEIKAQADLIEKPQGTDEKSLRQQLKDAQQRANETKATFDSSVKGYAERNGVSMEEALKAHHDTAYQMAMEDVARLDKIIKANEEKQKELKDSITKNEKSITDTLNEGARLDKKKLLGDKTAQEKDAEEAGKALGDKLKKGFESMFGEGSTINSWTESIKDWAEEQNKEYEKDLEDKKRKAESFRNGLKSDFDKIKTQFDEAKGTGLVSKDELDKYLTGQAKPLIKEAKDIENSRHSVYQLPDVKDLRSGQALYVPPTAIDEKQLLRLEEIRNLLAQISNLGSDNGMIIEEIGGLDL